MALHDTILIACNQQDIINLIRHRAKQKTIETMIYHLRFSYKYIHFAIDKSRFRETEQLPKQQCTSIQFFVQETVLLNLRIICQTRLHFGFKLYFCFKVVFKIFLLQNSLHYLHLKLTQNCLYIPFRIYVYSI